MRLEKLRDIVRKVKVLSPRASVVVSMLAHIVTKPVGYVRLVLIAYLFGASAGMDAYYIANGAIALAMGLAMQIVQTAVMPNLMKLSAKDDAAARSFFAYVVRFVLVWGGAATVLMMIFPSECIWLFASSLDGERVSVAANMLLLLLPLGYFQLLSALLHIWANYRGMYSMINVVNMFASPAGLLALLILAPILGVYSVALSLSVVTVIFSLAALYLLRDMPFRPKVPIPKSVLGKTGSDAVMCLGMMGASVSYTVVDRWFAAGLEAGNISAISYAAQVTSLAMMMLSAVSQMHITHMSRISDDAARMESSLNKSLAVGWAYMLPVACAVGALSLPVIRIVFGYGSFDEQSVALTAPCLSILAAGMPFSVWSSLMGNYGLAASKLKMILALSYVSVLFNIFLDWLFAPIWGAAGLCAATVMNQATVGVYYIYRTAPRGTLAAQIPCAMKQAAFSLVWAPGLFLISDSTFISVAAGAAMIFVHLFVCEYLGWLEPVPESWRPRAMIGIVLNKIVSRGEPNAR